MNIVKCGAKSCPGFSILFETPTLRCLYTLCMSETVNHSLLLDNTIQWEAMPKSISVVYHIVCYTTTI